MKRITLNGIKRRGLVAWKGREWWSRQTVSIWSREHVAWWRHEAKGYTGDKAQAWTVDFPTAYDQTKHCGPEKQIVFYALPAPLTQAECKPVEKTGESQERLTPEDEVILFATGHLPEDF